MQNTAPLHPTDEHFLRMAFDLARQSRALGADPFGAVLVRDGAVVYAARDRCVETSDPCYHAELSVISDYCRAHTLFSLEGYTLYCSAEPCPMCAGAIHWARVSRVVFSVSQAMLQGLSGGTPKQSAEGIINTSDHRRIEVIGPLIPDEGLAVFDGYRFVPKSERHRARFRSAEQGQPQDAR